MAGSVELTVEGGIIVTLGAQQGMAGPQGPIGPAGGSATTKLSTGALSGHRALRYVDADHVAVIDALTLAHKDSAAGVSLTAASGAEESVTVIRAGEVAEGSWSWAPGLPIFAGPSGLLTQTHSTTWAFALVVGVALSATRMVVDIRGPITQ